MTIKICTAAVLVLVFSIGAAGCKPRPAETAPGASAPGRDQQEATAVAPSTPAQAVSFKPDRAPLATGALPPFPLLDWPKVLPKSEYTAEEIDFTQAWVLAGNEVRKVEGRVEKRQFYNKDAKLSALA